MERDTHTTIEKIIHSLKYFFIVGILLIIISSIVIVVYQNNAQKKSDASIALLEKTDEAYNEIIINLKKNEASSEKQKKLIKDLKIITKKYPNSFAAQKAYIHIGLILSFSKASYKKALENFLNATTINRKSYLIPIAYFQAGLIEEKQNNKKEAKNYYQIVADITSNNIVRAHALFSLGRITEETAQTSKEKKNAIGYYKAIINDTIWKKSEWASLAKTRILYIKHNE